MNIVRLLLVVEDDDDLRYLVMRQLKRLGFPAHYATTGAEAVRMVQEHQYNLILMDVMMPDMDGMEATRQIRELERKHGKAHKPILAMTAFQDKYKCIQAGMDDFLQKPVMLDDLDFKLQQWLPSNGSNGEPKAVNS